MEIRVFEDPHVEGAAAALSRRHERHLETQPLLATHVDYRQLIEGEREGSTGAVALDAGVVVGYLLGARRDDQIGPHVWSTSAGHAADDPEVIADLYTSAAAVWAKEGLTRHFVFAPADRSHVEPWFRLGFGASLVLAARHVGDSTEPDHAFSGTVRPGESSDLRAAAALDRELSLHLARSPSFSGLEVGGLESFEEDWEGTWEDERFMHFVAEMDGRVAGHLLLFRRPAGDLRIPANSIDLAHAVTEPSLRGLGVGSALTAAALGWAREQGLSTMTIDWRATNIQAARFWSSRQFRPTFLRLYRSIP